MIKSGKADEGMGLDWREVSLSRATGWTYSEIVTQPAWFIERLMLYMQAETIVGNINKQKQELKPRQPDVPVKGKNYGDRYSNS